MTAEQNARSARVALGQSLYREMNELLEAHRPPSAFIEFVCECADEGCADPVPLTASEYEAVRRVPTRFFVKRGHDIDEVERVVDATERFAVVEKVGAGMRVAQKLDPRERNARRWDPILKPLEP